MVVSAAAANSDWTPGRAAKALLAAAFGAAVLAVGLSASNARAQAALPDTQAEIEAEILAKKRAGGGRVVVAPGVIDILELRVPSTVTLAGSGTLGRPTTTLRLKGGSNGGLVTLGGGSRGKSNNIVIENLVLDGNRANQSPDRYVNNEPVPRPAVLTMICSNCMARHLRVLNAMYDGVQASVGQNITVTNVFASVAGRVGIVTTSSVDGVKIYNSIAQHTGRAWRFVGGGAGVGAGGKNVEVRFVKTFSTNGDGISGYASTNADIRVLDSEIRGARNHCVHIGGDRALIQRNKCYKPRLAGYYMANDWRPGLEDLRDAVGGRILDNYVENAGTEGVHLQWYVAKSVISGNTVMTSFNDNYGVFDSAGVTVTKNIGRWPGTGRNAASPHCHLKISNSRSVAHFSNNFSYQGRTRPLTC